MDGLGLFAGSALVAAKFTNRIRANTLSRCMGKTLKLPHSCCNTNLTLNGIGHAVSVRVEMKSPHSLCPLAAVLLAVANIQASPPPEVAAARTRYDAAVKAAAAPVRSRYLDDLQQLKNRAMAQKNLPLAVAVDAEIAAVSGAAAGQVAKSAQELAESLYDTLWSWGVTEAKAESKLHFFKDGTYVIYNAALCSGRPWTEPR